MKITLNLNEQKRQVNVAPDTPLLWVIRDTLGLTGTKFGCGAGLCGACTVHLNGEAVRSCSLPVSAVGMAKILTIETRTSETLQRLQEAWIHEQVPQCGYCQSGMLMAASALLQRQAHPTDEEIEAAMTNLCRCGTYTRIRRAIKRAAGNLVEESA